MRLCDHETQIFLFLFQIKKFYVYKYTLLFENMGNENSIINKSCPPSPYRQTKNIDANGWIVVNKTNHTISIHCERGKFFCGTVIRPNVAATYTKEEVGGSFSFHAEIRETIFTQEESNQYLQKCAMGPLSVIGGGIQGGPG